MGYFQVMYDSRVVIYNCRAFIRLGTGVHFFSGEDCKPSQAIVASTCLTWNTSIMRRLQGQIVLADFKLLALGQKDLTVTAII